MAEKSKGQSRPRDWPRGTTILAVLGVLLVGAGIYVVQSLPRFGASPSGGSFSNSAPDRLTRAVQQVFAADCLSGSQASSAVRGILRNLGYSDWSVESARGVTPDGCVDASIAADKHQVILLPALSAAVRSAIHELQNNSYDSCLTERQVADLLTAALTKLGQKNFNVRTDGPLIAPTDRFKQVEKHVLSGCWVYSGTGLSETGRRIFYLVGPP